jgi:hypothetical protein
MQGGRHRVQIVVKQVRVSVQRDLGRLVSEHALQRKYIHPCTFTPADTANDAQVWRRSCGVTVCVPAAVTARLNHPLDDFGRGG